MKSKEQLDFERHQRGLKSATQKIKTFNDKHKEFLKLFEDDIDWTQNYFEEIERYNRKEMTKEELEFWIFERVEFKKMGIPF